jgi:hypothetical protein
MGDFAQISAPCRAINSTNQIIRSAAIECKEAMCMIRLVDLRARHSANVSAKRGYFARYLVLKDASSLKTVRARLYVSLHTSLDEARIIIMSCNFFNARPKSFNCFLSQQTPKRLNKLKNVLLCSSYSASP